MRYMGPIHVLGLSMLAPYLLLAQGGTYSVNNYVFVSEQTISITQSYVTYKADLVNTGKPEATVSAVATSLNPSSFTVVSGQDTLLFGPVPGNGKVTSSNTFTLRVNRAIPFDFANVQWTFQSSPLPPVANAGPNQTAKVGDTVTLDGSGSTNPSGVGTLTYSWAFTYKPGGRATIPNPNAVMPTFVLDVSGNFVITLTVSNGLASSSASVTVSTANSPPVANAGPNQTVALGSTVVLDGSHSSDVDGDPLTYQWAFMGLPSGSKAVLTGANTVSPTFVADKPGVYTVQLTVSDPTSSSAPVQITISTVNTAPVAKAGPNQVVPVGATVQLDGSGSTDVDGDPLTYSWSVLNAPNGSSVTQVTNPTSVSPTFKVDLPGTYMIQLTVSDGKLSSTATVTITTNSILQPTANAGPNQTIVHGRTVSLSGSGLDPQGLPLTYFWSLPGKPQGSAAAILNPTAQNASFFADLPGAYSAQLVVNNGFLSSQPSLVGITTTNNLPVANAGSNQNGTVGTTVQLNGSGSTDADNDPLTYSWSILHAPAGSIITQVNNPTGVSPTFTPDLAGQYVVQLIVNDGIGNSAPSTTTITVVSSLRMSLSPNPLNITTTGAGSIGTASLTLTLPFAAAADQDVQLSSLNGNVVSVPSKVTVPAGGTTATVTVTPVGAGNTTVIATCQSPCAYQPGSAVVNVTAATITLSFDTSNIGVTRAANGTITLSSPAPSPNLSVALSASPGGVVTLQPTTVIIPAGSSTGTFTATGATTGTTTITATAQQYSSGSASLNVGLLGTIQLPPTVTAAVGQSAPLMVSLASPAPVNGVTIDLQTTDNTVATITPSSVFIAAQATTPSTLPVVNGLKQGSTPMSASAGGFTGATGTINVVGGLVITTASLAKGAVGTPYTQSLAVSGGTGPYTWQITSGALPAGLTLNGSTISGTPTASANATPLTIKVSDSNAPALTATANFTLTIATQLTISTPALSNGVINVAYSQPLAASGGTGPYSWQLTSGVLPTGLTLDPLTGTISGTPTASVSATPLGIKVTDSGSPVQTATANFTLTIGTQLTITTASLANGVVGSAYSQTLGVAGGVGPFNWQLTSGALPAGLTLGATTGQISGTPTAAANATPLTFKVTDSASPAQTATANLTLTINGALTITTTSLPNGVVGTFYSLTLAASGGTGTYSWQLTSGALPAGISLNPTTGQLLGTPTAAATATPLAFKVTDNGSPAQSASANFTLTIATQLTITTTSLPNGVVNTPYSQILAAAGGSGTYSWQLISGVLPAGLTLNGTSGQLSGTPTATVTATPLGIKVTDTGTPSQSASATLTLTIGSQLSITTTSLPNGVVGTPYSLQLAAGGGVGTLSWQLTSGALPAGLTMSTSGLISGTPTAAVVATPLTFKVTDSSAPAQTASANLALTITPQLTITTSSLPNGQVNVAYSVTLAASNGTAPLTWQLTSGALPAGLTLDPSTGAISGTPTAAASATPLTFKVTDSSSPAQTATANLTLTITPALTITTTSLPGGAVNVPYSTMLAATNGTGTLFWQLTSGALPAGLTLNTSGLINGTPTTAVSATPLTFKVTDSASPAQSATASLTLTIAPQLVITTTSLPNGVTGTVYSLQLGATGGTGSDTWQLTSGALPAGLTVNTSGLISGTPTAAVSATPLTFKVTDSASPAQSAAANFTLTINAQLVVTTSTLPSGQVGVAYSQSLAASGGVGPYSWQLTSGTMPAGLTVNTSGQISGTPTATTAATQLTFKVTDTGTPAQSATATLSLAIAPGPLTITTLSLPDGIATVPYSKTLTASGGQMPYVWSLQSGRLPAGLTLDPSTGIISGTPTTPGSSSLTFKVTDTSSPVQTATMQLPLTIGLPVLTITTTTLPSGQVGSPYSLTLAAAGGTTPFNWTITLGTLPAGMNLNPSTGMISGTPTVAVSNLKLVFQVTDTSTPAQNASATLFLTIAPPTLTITTTSLPNGTINTPYSQMLAATGGTGSYSWQLTSGALPAGLTLNSTSGLISGTPTANISATPLTFKVSDTGTPVQTATANLTLTIGTPVLTITTTSLPNGVVGTAYLQSLAATGGSGTYSWQLTSGALPAGLTLNTSSGQITGTPTAAVAATPLSFKVTDTSTPVQTATANLTLTIAPQLVITTTSLPNGAVGTAYSQTLAATGGTGADSWQLTSGVLPAGLTLNASNGQITGTPTAAVGATPLTFKVTDAGSPAQTATANLTLTIAPQLVITTTSLPNGAVGTAYSQGLASTGGTGAVSWQLTSGSLPAGLTLNASSGLISGTPTASATATPLTFKATDTGLPVQTATVSLSLTITGPPLNITTTSLPLGVANSPYTATLAATGGTTPYSWSITSGRLPTGLTLDGPSGVISGTPQSATSTSVTFKVMDSSSPAQALSTTLTIDINPPGLTIVTTSPLPGGSVGVPYSLSLTAAGGTSPYTWQVTSGSLPSGLTLSTAGLLSGTPALTIANDRVTIQVTDSASPAATLSTSFTITIANSPLTITTSSLPNGQVGVAYSQSVAASGGTSPYAWQLTSGTLPAGLTFNTTTGAITGTPTAAVTAAALSFKVTDASTPVQNATANLTLTIAPTTLTISTTTLPSGTVGIAYSQSLAATGGTTPYNWQVATGTLPAGLTLNASTGLISGTPTAGASSALTFKVTDAGPPVQTATSGSITLNIFFPPVTITTSSLPDGRVGVGYSQTLAASGGTGTYSWQLTSGSLPAGLTLNTSTGAITGTPTTAVVATPLTFKATDTGTPAQSASANLTLTIQPPLLIITTTSPLPNAQVNVPYSQTLAATGGTGAYNWQVASGTLPAGLTLNATSGAITGTPTTAIVAALTFKVTDAGSPAQTATSGTISLTVLPPGPAITTSALPNGAVGTPYSLTLAAQGGTLPYGWQLTSGALPAGLTFNTSTGAITGTPSATATATPLSFKLTDSSSPVQTATASLTLTIQPQLILTTSSLPAGTINVAYSTTLAATGGAGAYTWHLTSGTLPTGLTLNTSTGQISGTPTVLATATPLTFSVTDVGLPSQTAAANLTLTIAPPVLVITTSTLPSGQVGVPYSQSLAATGGTGAYNWQVTGTLPTGLTLNASTGAITGTPSAQAAPSLTFKVTDAGTPAQTASVTLTLTINPATLVLSTTSLPNGTANAPYSATLAATGGTLPYAWQLVSGTMPTGLTLNGTTGAITGTPTQQVTASLTFKVTDAGTQSATSNVLTLTIGPPGLAITTSALVNGAVGTPYSLQLAASGGTPGYTWQLTGGALPAGLTLSSGGLISGTPGATANATSLTFKVTDNGSPAQTASTTLTLTIAPQLVITTSSLTSGIVGTPYAATLAATGGNGNYSWQLTAGALPAGLTLNAAGQISGTPTAAATATPLTFKVTDTGSPVQTASATLSLTIATQLVITTTSLPNGNQNTPYTTTLAATGGSGTYSWQLTSGTMPTGLTLNPTSGTISGTPTLAVSATPLTFKVTDTGSPVQNATANLTLTIIPPVLTITTSSLAKGVVGTPYMQNMAATGGTGTDSWQITSGTLPAGLTMSGSGVISGTPTAAATAVSLIFKVTDSGTPVQTATVTLPITIAPQLVITTSTLSNAVQNSPYTATLAATGGTGAYNWQVASGVLPAGLTLNPSSGQISGTPTGFVNATPLTFKVTDSDVPAQTATVSLTLTVIQQLVVTTSSLPNGTLGVAYTGTLAATGGSGTYSWQLTSGTLPAGLTLNVSTGAITGTPTATANAVALTFKVTDTGTPAQSASSTGLTLTIVSVPVITTTSLPDGIAGVGYTATLAASGGTPPYTWTGVSGLPNGLVVTPAGQIQGTPGTPGTYSAVIKVTDSLSATATTTLQIRIVRQLSITTPSLPGAVANPATPYSVTLTTNGGLTPLTWSATGLPIGLTIDNTGTISGTPSTSAQPSNTVVVTATDASNPPQTASATYTLLVSGTVGIAVTNLSLGQDLQDLVTITLAQPAGAAGVPITVTSGDPTKLLISAASGPAAQLVTSIGAGQSSVGIVVQGRANSGVVQLTVSSNGSQAVGNVTLFPSGFVVAAGLNPGGSFNTTQGATTTVTVSSARLDASMTFVQAQAVRTGLTVTVPLSLSSPQVGSVSPTSVTFNGGDMNVPTSFLAAITGNLNPASTSITANVPAIGNFVIPSQSANVLTAFVAGAGLLPCNATVGKGLEALCNITLTGNTTALLNVTLVSNSPNLLLSNSPTGVGQNQITVTVQPGHSVSSDFYVYGLASTGSGTYSASGGNLGTVNGTITFAPSGFIISGPNLGVNFQTQTGVNVSVSISSVMLTSTGDAVAMQNVAGNGSITVSTTNTPIPPAVNVGSLVPAQVSIAGGSGSGFTTFQPDPNNVGSTVLGLVQPSGFTTPNQYATVTATVVKPGINCQTPGGVGYHLQVQAQCTLGVPASAGLVFTLASNDPSNLLASTDPTKPGQGQVTITLNAGDQNVLVNLYGLATAGSPGFSASAPGYKTFNGTIQLTPSAIVIGNGPSFLPTLVTSVANGPAPLTVATISLDPGTGLFSGFGAAAGGFPLLVQLNDSNPATGTIDKTSVTFNGNDSLLNVTFTPVQTGNTSIGIVSVPPNFSIYPGFGSVGVTVN